MKKRFLIPVLVFVCAAYCFTGCGLGNYVENGGDKNPPPSGSENLDNPDKPDKPDDPNTPTGSGSSYTATVFYNNVPYNPSDVEIKVVWRNESEIKKAALGEDGKAVCELEDGKYSVYLEGLPEKFTYDPNGYEVSPTAKDTSILITDVRKPESGDGGGLYQSQGCYVVRYDGTYRAKVKKEDSEVFYEYSPSAAGWYSITSCVNIYENNVDPGLKIYGGTIGYKWLTGTSNEGGASLPGGFTKNFRYDCYVDAASVGSSFTIGVTADHRMGEYPVNVDFRIKYEGEYSDEYSDVRIIRAKEAFVKAAEKQSNETFVFADMGTKVFDMANYKYNEDTGFYHRYDETLYADDPYGFGKNFGPYLCFALNKSLPSYPQCKLYEANAQGLGGGSNWLKLAHNWIEEEQKYAVFDYTFFVREDYYKMCNSDGVCYVTEEIRAFLQKYAENHALYTDGLNPADSTPESLGYAAKQDALWLFACGFYTA